MVEAVVAVTLFTLVGAAVLGGLSTTFISGGLFEGQSAAETLGRSQMENALSLPYQVPPSTYPAISAPPGYSVTAAGEEYEVGSTLIEKLVVRVMQGNKEVLVLETLRAQP